MNQAGTFDPTTGKLITIKTTPNCRVCQKAGVNRCSKCNQANYCSRTCQVGDWADHKVECRMIALSNAVSDENILRDPTNVRFLEVTKNWLNTYAGEDIAFAAASAFKLTNYYKPVDLIDTHFLLLFTEFVKEEILPRNQVKLFDAALVKTSDFLAGKDGYALNTLRKDVESFLKLPTISARSRGDTSVKRARIVVVGYGLGAETRERYACIVVTDTFPLYITTPAKPYQDHEGDEWLSGLKQNLKSDNALSIIDMAWRPRVRVELLKLTRQVPSVSDYQTTFFLPHRLMDHAVDFNRSLPGCLRKSYQLPIHCSSPDCQATLKNVEDDPATRQERERILRAYLMRDFEDLLVIAMIESVEEILVENELSQSRMIQLLLGGATLENLTSIDFAEGNAIHLVRLILNRKTTEGERIIVNNAFTAMGPFSHRLSDDPRGRTVSPTELLRIAEKQNHLDFVCLHQLVDIYCIQKLETWASQVLPMLNPSSTSSLFKKIEYHIEKGDIQGPEIKDELVWEQKVLAGLELFSRSIRKAIKTYVVTTPTYAAFHRQFLRDSPSVTGFVHSMQSPSRRKQICQFLNEGGIIKPQDPIFAARKLELKNIKFDGKEGSTNKLIMNAKKQAKKNALKE